MNARQPVDCDVQPIRSRHFRSPSLSNSLSLCVACACVSYPIKSRVCAWLSLSRCAVGPVICICVCEHRGDFGVRRRLRYSPSYSIYELRHRAALLSKRLNNFFFHFLSSVSCTRARAIFYSSTIYFFCLKKLCVCFFHFCAFVAPFRHFV